MMVPCATAVPDIELICEMMLIAEGFIDICLLAKKLINLHILCRELLPKQDHYSWGPHAIKYILVAAGPLKQGDKNRSQNQRTTGKERHSPCIPSLWWFVQLEELLGVHHSVFVIGNAETGKSVGSSHTYMNVKQKPVWNDLNPKALAVDELFGFIHPATQEWKDGK
ncbi:hypothetical protein AV530_014439 [Patagioenas fasciata monilis]|uniref:Dynein heavy chain hydrolytic ATP-binding dynein motor region domain-containing protein n=1 Tax=Patagioenas fasciata monilis TaxID=372326 RepID=A0A1V4KBZ5_PATFA|nr:hypothetical protein AV530_014439 [Patagioenas fasciata monilis]